MIHWLVQAAQPNSDLARGVAPPGLLHPVEQCRLAKLTASKRRRDWLLGRWTAKHLLQACLARDLQVRLPLNKIGIDHDVQGAPVAFVDCGSRLADWAISISHSHDCGFAAAMSGAALGLGADIEHVEPREWRFVEDYFTPDEIERVRAAPCEHRDRLITAIWSAKEAALKALHLGLVIDTRQVSCAIDPRHCAPRDWTEFKVDYAAREREPLSGWWRAWHEFVLTVALA